MNVILMCGGLSKRFLNEENKNVCKITYNISGKPMIIHILEMIQKLDINNKIFVVLSITYGKNIIDCIEKYIKNTSNILYTYQDTLKSGTAGAVLSCIEYLKKSTYKNTLILSGDVPYLSENTIKNLVNNENNIIITRLDNPYGNGRIIFENNYIIDIVEEKDCDYSQKLINLVNTGNYYLETINIINLIPLIKNENKSNEYYLTDIVKLLYLNKIKLHHYELLKENQYEIYNINTLNDLKNAEKMYNDIYYI